MKKTNAKVLSEEIVKMLNRVYSQEWYECYHHNANMKHIEGPLKEKIEEELMQQSKQELNHVALLDNRIKELGSQPVLIAPGQLRYGNSDKSTTEDPYVEIILNEKLKRKCYLIQQYKAIAEFTKDKDESTHCLIISILNEEFKHERSIERFIVEIYQIKEDIINQISRFIQSARVPTYVPSEA